MKQQIYGFRFHGNTVKVIGSVNYQGGGNVSNSILAIVPVAPTDPPTTFSLVPKHYTAPHARFLPQLSQVNVDATLVQVIGTVVNAPPGQFSGIDPQGCKSNCYGYKVWISNGITTLLVFLNLPPGTDFKCDDYKVGSKLKVTGLSGRYITPEMIHNLKRTLKY